MQRDMSTGQHGIHAVSKDQGTHRAKILLCAVSPADVLQLKAINSSKGTALLTIA